MGDDNPTEQDGSASVNIRENGRYIEIYIDGVGNGALAFDQKQTELIVQNRENITRTIELPRENNKSSGSEGEI